MPRPGAVIEVDRNTPPVLFHFGEGVRLERLPLGARIVYPPDPLEPSSKLVYRNGEFALWAADVDRSED